VEHFHEQRRGPVLLLSTSGWLPTRAAASKKQRWSLARLQRARRGLRYALVPLVLPNDAARAGARLEKRRLCVAYRQLCAVTLAVLGWLTVGCGSGSGAVAVPDVTEDQPPANPDRPVNNASDRSSNADQPPANPDQPPSDSNGLPSTGGGGGNAEALCQTFCQSIQGKDCTGAGGLNGAVRFLCNSGCVLSAEEQACASEIAQAISCISGISTICTDDFNQDQRDVCKDSFDAVDACGEAHQQPDDNAPSCTDDGGCACDDPCATCRCNAGTDLQALAACGTGACAP
jgi:hypothetical protein